MNKAELIQQLEVRLGSKKVAAEAVNGVVDIITRAVVKGEKVSITGFGTFEKVVRAARKGRNPRTGESVKIKRTSVPKFRAGATLKGYVADPKSLPKAEKPAAKTAAAKPVVAKKAATKVAAKPAAKKTATKVAAKPAAKKATATKAVAAKKTATKAAAKPAAKKAVATKATATKTAAKKSAAKVATKAAAKPAAKKTTAKKAAAKK